MPRGVGVRVPLSAPNRSTFSGSVFFVGVCGVGVEVSVGSGAREWCRARDQ